MSLFPAYEANVGNKKKDEKEDAGPSWLTNSSFPITESEKHSLVITTSSSSDDEKKKKSSKRHKEKKRNKKHKSEKEIRNEKSEFFYEDTQAKKRGDTEFDVPQVKLTKPSTSYDSDKRKRKKKKKDRSRYFQKKIEQENEEKNSLVNPEPMHIEEFLKRTEIFNQQLRKDPHDIKMWLDYVRLQDSGIGSIRGRAEKKLSILDRALEVNSGADELLHEKMSITESIFPLDKISAETKSIVSKFPKSVVGWQWVVNSLQFSLSKMTAPGVLINYERALEGINKAFKDSEVFLDFFLQCGLFLRQSGLWEQLWVLLQLYLELNLTNAGSEAFNITLPLPEDEIQKLEDNITLSGLPLGALWLRIERLREGIYFLPVDDSSDPQRMVFREDLSQLLFPITLSNFTRLILNCLLILKVPPLPLSDAFYRYTRLHKISWSLDSVEIIIAAKFSKFSGNDDYLDVIIELLSGPQYLVESLGQSQFFNFVNNVFEKCIMYNEVNSQCFLMWQMRWWRWTYSVLKRREVQTNDSLKKNFLNRAKKILKVHRDCIPLYIEYALLEYEGGDLNTCLKVLETTMHLRSPPLLAGTIEKKHLCLLYKEYVELLIEEDINLYKEKILSALVALAFGEPIKNIVINDDLLVKCNEKFDHITTEVVRDIKNEQITMSEIIFPDYTVSWLSCHAWFVYINEGVKRSCEIIEKVIEQMEKSFDCNDFTLINVMLEQLYESLVHITLYNCKSIPGQYSTLYDILMRSLQRFPTNAMFYNAVYRCEVIGIKWQRMSSQILSCGSALSASFVYFITHNRLMKEMEAKGVAGNKLLSLLEKLKDSNERCPLFWRLLLQAYSLKSSDEIKQVFYRSIEKCPWAKVLYYEAAKLLPEDLPEIQDLLVEKELRLHATPEELEILREES